MWSERRGVNPPPERIVGHESVITGAISGIRPTLPRGAPLSWVYRGQVVPGNHPQGSPVFHMPTHLASLLRKSGHVEDGQSIDLKDLPLHTLQALYKATVPPAKFKVEGSNVKISPIFDSSGWVVGASAIARNITRQKRIERLLAHQALHDPLTDLPNRVLLRDRIENALARAQRNASAVAILFLDLDRFKPLNDERGHLVGDRILQQIAQRLRDAIRPDDTVARANHWQRGSPR